MFNSDGSLKEGREINLNSSELLLLDNRLDLLAQNQDNLGGVSVENNYSTNPARLHREGESVTGFRSQIITDYRNSDEYLTQGVDPVEAARDQIPTLQNDNSNIRAYNHAVNEYNRAVARATGGTEPPPYLESGTYTATDPSFMLLGDPTNTDSVDKLVNAYNLEELIEIGNYYNSQQQHGEYEHIDTGENDERILAEHILEAEQNRQTVNRRNGILFLQSY